MPEQFSELDPSDSNVISASPVLKKDTQEPSDDYLVQRVIQGDEVGMALLYDRYARTVYQVALRYLHHVPAAEDVVQEVFMMIWRRPSVVPEGDCSLASWMRRVAANRSIDLLRISSRRVTESLEDVVLASPHDYKKIADDRLLVERASACIDQLPVATRQIFVMVYEQDMTHLEVSMKTGCPLGTVKTRIRKGLLRVRKSMTEVQPACQLLSN